MINSSNGSIAVKNVLFLSRGLYVLNRLLESSQQRTLKNY